MYPVLFYIGSWPVYTYGVMVSLGFIAGYFLLCRWAEEEGVDEEHIVNLFLILVFASIIGARITYVITYPEAFRYNYWDAFRIWKGGLTILGGACLSFMCFILYCRMHKLNTALIIDLFSPCIALGLIIGRLGCLGFGCCYGKHTSLPWGLVFRYTDPVRPLAPRHPTQVYTSLSMLVIFLILRRIRKRPHPDGLVGVWFVYTYSVYRILIEFVRDDVSSEHYLFGLTLAQSMCIVATVATVLYHVLVLRKRPPDRGGAAEVAK